MYLLTQHVESCETEESMIENSGKQHGSPTAPHHGKRFFCFYIKKRHIRNTTVEGRFLALAHTGLRDYCCLFMPCHSLIMQYVAAVFCKYNIIGPVYI